MRKPLFFGAGRQVFSTTILLALPVAAMAQQADTSVNFYGRVDLSYVNQSGRGSAGPQTAVQSGVFQPSQFGLRVREDMGGGLKALFEVATTVYADTGTQASAARLFDRHAFVGIATADLGTLTVGRQVTPLAELFYATDPLKAGSGATNMNVRFGYLAGAGPTIANNFGPGASTTANNLDRQDNSIKYGYRNSDGIVATAMYAFGEKAGTTSANAAAGALLGYAIGSIALRSAIMRFTDASGIPLRSYALGGAYELNSVLQLKMTWTKNRIDSALAAYKNQETRVISAGLTWKAMQNLNLTVAHYEGKRVATGTPDKVARKTYFVSEYKLSKLSSLYALFDFERFNASGSELDTGTPLALGASASNYLVLGMAHNF